MRIQILGSLPPSWVRTVFQRWVGWVLVHRLAQGLRWFLWNCRRVLLRCWFWHRLLKTHTYWLVSNVMVPPRSSSWVTPKWHFSIVRCRCIWRLLWCLLRVGLGCWRRSQWRLHIGRTGLLRWLVWGNIVWSLRMLTKLCWVPEVICGRQTSPTSKVKSKEFYWPAVCHLEDVVGLGPVEFAEQSSLQNSRFLLGVAPHLRTCWLGGYCWCCWFFAGQIATSVCRWVCVARSSGWLTSRRVVSKCCSGAWGPVLPRGRL